MTTRRWAVLLVGDNNGLLAEHGHTFASSPSYYERLDVVPASALDALTARVAELEAMQLLGVHAICDERDRLRGRVAELEKQVPPPDTGDDSLVNVRRLRATIAELERENAMKGQQ